MSPAQKKDETASLNASLKRLKTSMPHDPRARLEHISLPAVATSYPDMDKSLADAYMNDLLNSEVARATKAEEALKKVVQPPDPILLPTTDSSADGAALAASGTATMTAPTVTQTVGPTCLRLRGGHVRTMAGAALITCHICHEYRHADCAQCKRPACKYHYDEKTCRCHFCEAAKDAQVKEQREEAKLDKLKRDQ